MSNTTSLSVENYLGQKALLYKVRMVQLGKIIYITKTKGGTFWNANTITYSRNGL